jgi:hypothetical protein
MTDDAISSIRSADAGQAADRDERVRGLRRFNLLMAALHLGQGLAVLALSSSFALPVTSAFLGLEGGKLVPQPKTLFEIRIGPAVALFLFLSAAAHLAISTGPGFKRYRSDLALGMNRARWIEYSLSSSVMIVIIAMLVGIYEITALIAIFGVNAAMILFGWVMEVHNQTTERTDWLAFWFGSIAGIVPWIAVAIYLIVPPATGGDGAPGFVFAIFFSIFLFFNVFAVNMVLQYRGRGRWADYLYGERVYIVLSLVAKSLLAWQVFAGTLQPS